MKKPRTAYFIFCSENRERVLAENPGLRVGDIQKIISTLWKQCPLEEKKRLENLANDEKKRYICESHGAPRSLETIRKNAAHVYPFARVKRIVQLDSEIKKISHDALVAISKATEIFVQLLSVKSYEEVLFRNKRQIKKCDVIKIIHSISMLDWMREDFPDKVSIENFNEITHS